MIIGLLGKARCGKDALASHLSEHQGFVTYHLASPLKDACRVLFDLSDDQMHGDAKDAHDDRLGTTPRKVMQTFGTDVMRARYGDDFWLRKFERFAASHAGDDIVVADVRFANEAEAIRRLGGVVIKIERPFLTHDDDHASENVDSVETFDYAIINDGTIEQYFARADRLVRYARINTKRGQSR